MVRLDLGCGYKKPEGYIGVDKVKTDCVDIVHNCEEGLPFDDNYADEIRAWDFLEHIHRENIIHLFNEIWRVLKPDGKLIFKVPDAEKGQGAFQDFTHYTFFVKNSFKYLENTYYKDLYGIKANFRIDKLESIQYLDENHYWGPSWALFGTLTSIKDKIPELEIKEPNRLNPNVIYITDDVCPSSLKYWKYWLEVKEKYLEIKVIAFVIANNKNKEDISKSQEFKKWFGENKDWVEIGVHGYDHLRPQECWRENQEIYIKKALEILRPYLPKKFLYRPPGFRVLPKTESIVKKLGFAGMAYQERIKYFDGRMIEPIYNTHCGNEGVNQITKIWRDLAL